MGILVKMGKVRRNTDSVQKQRERTQKLYRIKNTISRSFAVRQLVSGSISVSTEMQMKGVSQGYSVLLCKDLGMIFHSLPV